MQIGMPAQRKLSRIGFLRGGYRRSASSQSKVMLGYEIDQAHLGHGRSDALHVGMTETQLLEDYKDVFTGIGLFPGEYRIKLDPEVKPVVHAARKIPIVLQKRLEKELQDMQKKGVKPDFKQNFSHNGHAIAG